MSCVARQATRYNGRMSKAAEHPGKHIREKLVGERGLTVADAAKQLKVGRQALSTLLNGNSSLSPDMAKRLETAFGLNAAALLAMQTEFDAAKLTAPETVARFVVPVLEHKARELEQWAERHIHARQRMAVLLRMLVNSTASLSASDFPGNDDAERPGWDGWSVAVAGNPWVPAGKAGWEMGTNKEVRDKAQGDYEKSVKAHTAAEMADITFVFVTPRHWPEKDKWVEEKREEAKWRDVRAYDSNDLEQWLGQSVQAQAWLVNELGKPAEGLMSLDDAWRDFANVVTPSLPKALFDSALASSGASFIEWLRQPPTKPFVVASDSVEEALAFLSVLMDDKVVELQRARDRSVIFRRPGVLQRIAEGTKDFIAIAATDEVARELGRYSGELHAVVLQPRNAAMGEPPDVMLQQLTSEAFRNAFDSTGASLEDVTRWARESGRSLTVLRRRRATNPAIQAPGWVGDAERVKRLIPLSLAGTWDSANESDVREILALTQQVDAGELEERVNELVALADPPLWRASTYRGVGSKIDLLYATQKLATKQVLQRFMELAKSVLSEDDPALDLPEDDQWAAPVYGKQRRFSKALRDSVAETLVLLAVHGDELYAATGFKSKQSVDDLVRGLLHPFDLRTLKSNSRDMPAYAEAAPEVFLELFEKDLKKAEPVSFGLLTPSNSMFGSSPRVGLLWALEGLSWSEETLLPAALILARLATVEINDNLSNKPMASLASIFRPWMPQTAAPLEARVGVLRVICNRYPDVAWRLAIGMLTRMSHIGQYSHKPRWRNDGYGYGQPLRDPAPVRAFLQSAAQMLVQWPAPYDAERLCDLVGIIPSLDEAHVQRVWQIIRNWTGDDGQKALVREKVRQVFLSRRPGRSEPTAVQVQRAKEARDVYDMLQPSDVVARNAWLFRQHWIGDVALEGDEEEKLDTRARDERLRQLRHKAVREVFAVKSVDGLHELARSGKAARALGLAAAEALDGEQLHDVIAQSMRQQMDAALRDVVIGVLLGLQEEGRTKLLDRLASASTEQAMVDLLLLAPFVKETWVRVDKFEEDQQKRYWQKVEPGWFTPDEELQEAVQRLLDAERPMAAFAACEHRLRQSHPKQLYEILRRIARGEDLELRSRKLEVSWITEAFGRITESAEFTVEEKAALEFAYADALYTSRIGEGAERTFPSLERYMEEHPGFYVQLVAYGYKRADSGEDPEEMRVPAERVSEVAGRAIKVLESLSRLPAAGAPAQAYESLSAWIGEVRTRAREVAREGVADYCLGRLLAVEGKGADGVWPGELARKVLEEIASEQIGRGVFFAECNGRGVVARGPGGDQEREMAARYRKWANELRYTHPFVARKVLDELAKYYERLAQRHDEDTQVTERVRD